MPISQMQRWEQALPEPLTSLLQSWTSAGRTVVPPAWVTLPDILVRIPAPPILAETDTGGTVVWAAELAVVWLGAMRMLCCALSVPAQWRCVASVQFLP